MTIPVEDPTHPSARRSRWERFSPSMGWRAFSSEIVIVAIGVVIALGANEAVQQWSWNRKVADAEIRLKGDMDMAFFFSAEQRVTRPCVDAQLAALTDRLLQSGDTLDPATIHVTDGHRYVVRMPRRPYGFPVWDALVADGTASRFPPERQAMYGRINDTMLQARTGQFESSVRLAGRLLAMGHPVPLDASARRDFLIDIEETRWRNSADAFTSAQRMRAVAETAGAPAEPDVEAFLTGSGTVAFCQAQGLPLADWRAYGEQGRPEPTPSPRP